MEFVFEKIPIPPSSNNQYKSFVRRGQVMHVSSPELVRYKADFARWARGQRVALQGVQAALSSKRLKVSVVIYFRENRLIAKNGNFKRIDVGNRIKALHDCFAKEIGIDDSAFYEISARKQPVPVEAEEYCTLIVSLAD